VYRILRHARGCVKPIISGRVSQARGPGGPQPSINRRLHGAPRRQQARALRNHRLHRGRRHGRGLQGARTAASTAFRRHQARRTSRRTLISGRARAQRHGPCRGSSTRTSAAFTTLGARRTPRSGRLPRHGYSRATRWRRASTRSAPTPERCASPSPSPTPSTRHRQGVVHRDLKPGNHLTSGAKLLDFGLAKERRSAV